MATHEGMEVLSFADRADLRGWLVTHHATHPGGWVRLGRSGSGGLSFTDLLEEGLCFGWSESTRHAGEDRRAYLQRFTPRRRPGTASERNRRLVERLATEGLMTDAGYAALRLPR